MTRRAASRTPQYSAPKRNMNRSEVKGRKAFPLSSSPNSSRAQRRPAATRFYEAEAPTVTVERDRNPVEPSEKGELIKALIKHHLNAVVSECRQIAHHA